MVVIPLWYQKYSCCIVPSVMEYMLICAGSQVKMQILQLKVLQPVVTDKQRQRIILHTDMMGIIKAPGKDIGRLPTIKERERNKTRN